MFISTTIKALVLSLVASSTLAAPLNPPVFLNEINYYDYWTKGEQYVCKSGVYLGSVTRTLYDKKGNKVDEMSLFKSDTYTCPDTSLGLHPFSNEWTTEYASVKDGVMVCIHSSEYGVLQFLGFGTNGKIQAVGGTCHDMFPTSTGAMDLSPDGTESVRLVGSGCNYEDFTWLFDGLDGNILTIPNIDQTISCTPEPTQAPTPFPTPAPTPEDQCRVEGAACKTESSPKAKCCDGLHCHNHVCVVH